MTEQGTYVGRGGATSSGNIFDLSSLQINSWNSTWCETDVFQLGLKEELKRRVRSECCCANFCVCHRETGRKVNCVKQCWELEAGFRTRDSAMSVQRGKLLPSAVHSRYCTKSWLLISRLEVHTEVRYWGEGEATEGGGCGWGGMVGW